jgi:hypothetical protein
MSIAWTKAIFGWLPGPHPETGFPLLEDTLQETVIGKHLPQLDFAVSISTRNGMATVSTAVHYNNALGYVYFGVVRLFHPLAVRFILQHMETVTDS